MSAVVVGPSHGSYLVTLVPILVVLRVYSGSVDKPSLTVVSKKDEEDNFRVSKGFFCCLEEGASSLLSHLRR